MIKLDLVDEMYATGLLLAMSIIVVVVLLCSHQQEERANRTEVWGNKHEYVHSEDCDFCRKGPR